MLPYQIFQRYLAFPYPTHSFCLWLLTILLIVRPNAVATNIFTSYANDFVDPTHAAGQYASNLRGAQDTIVAWANEMNSYGPWSTQILFVVSRLFIDFHRCHEQASGGSQRQQARLYELGSIVRLSHVLPDSC